MTGKDAADAALSLGGPCQSQRLLCGCFFRSAALLSPTRAPPSLGQGGRPCHRCLHMTTPLTLEGLPAQRHPPAVPGQGANEAVHGPCSTGTCASKGYGKTKPSGMVGLHGGGGSSTKPPPPPHPPPPPTHPSPPTHPPTHTTHTHTTPTPPPNTPPPPPPHPTHPPSPPRVHRTCGAEPRLPQR